MLIINEGKCNIFTLMLFNLGLVNIISPFFKVFFNILEIFNIALISLAPFFDYYCFHPRIYHKLLLIKFLKRFKYVHKEKIIMGL